MITVISPDAIMDDHGGVTATPAGMVTDWRAIAELLNDRWAINTLIVYDDPIPRGGVECAIPLMNAGWSITTGDSGWITISKPWVAGTSMSRSGQSRKRYVYIGRTSLIREDPMIGGMQPTAAMHRLDAWRRATGTDYRVSPAVSAIASIRDVGRRLSTPPRWKLQDPASTAYWQPPGQIYSARLGDVRNIPSGLYGFDRRQAFLADAAATMLPFKQLPHTGTDPRQYGYFRVRSDWPALEMLGPADELGCRWVGHNVLAEIEAANPTYEIVDSHTTDQAGRWLRRWAEKWRDAMVAYPGARSLFKAGYAQALGGLLATTGGTIYRPDVRHLIMDACNAHTLRNALTVQAYTDQWPEVIDVDALYYRGARAILHIRTLGPHMGNYVHKGQTS